MTKCLGNAFSPGRTYTARRLPEFLLDDLTVRLTEYPIHLLLRCAVSLILTQLFTGCLSKNVGFRAILFYSEGIIHNFHNKLIINRNPRCEINLGDVDGYRVTCCTYRIRVQD